MDAQKEEAEDGPMSGFAFDPELLLRAVRASVRDQILNEGREVAVLDGPSCDLDDGSSLSASSCYRIKEHEGLFAWERGQTRGGPFQRQDEAMAAVFADREFRSRHGLLDDDLDAAMTRDLARWFLGPRE
jgi:hypothetical protein